MGTVGRRAELVGEASPPGPKDSLVVQISRWDRLKDHAGVLKGFEMLVRDRGPDGTHLILAGPSPAAVTDDPEGVATFEEIVLHQGLCTSHSFHFIHQIFLHNFNVLKF